MSKEEDNTPYVSPRLWEPTHEGNSFEKNLRGSVVRESTSVAPPSTALGAGTIFMGVILFIAGLILLILSFGEAISIVIGRVFGIILIIIGLFIIIFGSLYFGLTLTRHGKLKNERERLDRIRQECINSTSWANKTEHVRKTPEELERISNLFVVQNST